MKLPTEITFRHMDRSEALVSDILSKVEKLGELFNRVTRCEVVVEAPHRRHHQGKLYRVRIELSLPKRELIVGHESHDKHQHEDPFVAVRDAFDAIRRQLMDYVQEQRGETKVHPESPSGYIARICLPEGPDFPGQGYGFISTRDGREVYFHANSLEDVDFERLEIGSEVDFVEEQGDDGPQATFVRMAGGQLHHIS